MAQTLWFWTRYMAAAGYDVATSFAGYRLWPPRIVGRDERRRDQVTR